MQTARRTADRRAAVALINQVVHSAPSISAAGLFEVSPKLFPTVRALEYTWDPLFLRI